MIQTYDWKDFLKEYWDYLFIIGISLGVSIIPFPFNTLPILSLGIAFVYLKRLLKKLYLEGVKLGNNKRRKGF